MHIKWFIKELLVSVHIVYIYKVKGTYPVKPCFCVVFMNLLWEKHYTATTKQNKITHQKMCKKHPSHRFFGMKELPNRKIFITTAVAQSIFFSARNFTFRKANPNCPGNLILGESDVLKIDRTV